MHESVLRLRKKVALEPSIVAMIANALTEAG